MAYCIQCSKQIRSGVQFCPHCGAGTGKKKSNRSIKEKPSESAKRSGTSKKRKQPRSENKQAKRLHRRTLIIKAAAKALGKSLVLSTAILGPGLALVSFGYPVPGMIWLFFGSFALMAWTYSKPWLLTWFSCFAPAAGSAICYIAQVSLFGLPPLDMLLIVSSLGIGFGYWRSTAHRFYVDGQAVMAQRTLVYLLVWAAAYAATQIAGFMGHTSLARKGLVTGAFTTSMLIAVSVMVFLRYRQVRTFLFILVIAGFFLTPAPGFAADYYWELKEIRLDHEWRQRTPHFVELTNTSLVLQDQAHKLSFSWTLPKSKIIRPGETVWFTMYCQYERFNASARINTNNWLKARMFGFIRPPESKNYHVGWVDPTIPHVVMNNHPNLKFVDTLKVKLIGPQKPADSLYLQLWLEDQNIGYPMGGEAVGFIFKRVGGPEPQAISSGTGEENRRRPRGEIRPPLESPWHDLDTLKKLVLITTLVLTGIGICINVAQAIAVAIANALQAGVQFTSEEIREGITDALLDRRPGRDFKKTKSLSGETTGEPVKPPSVITIPGGQTFDTNDAGQYLAPDEKGNWRWVTEQEARESAKALWQEESAKERQRAEHEDETEKIRDKWRQDTQERYARERQQEFLEKAKREAEFQQFERVEKAATTVGDFDILTRTGEERIFKQDGSIDTQYLDRVRAALYKRIGRDVAMPDSKLEDNSLTRAVRETLDDSMEDATNSFWTRMAAGMASGGTSEIAFQGRDVWNAVKKAAEDAEDRGEKMSAADSISVVTTKIAKDNLPVNTLDALNRMRKGEDVSLAELGMSTVADLFSAAELGQTMGVKTGDVLEGLGRRVLSEDAVKTTGNIHSKLTAGVEKISAKTSTLAGKANDAFDGLLERQGLKNPGSRLDAAHAAAKLESGRLTTKTTELIESIQGAPSRATIDADNAFHAGRNRGKQQVDNLISAIDELDAVRASGKATPAELSQLENRVRAEVVRVQADKHAMHTMNRLPKGADGNNPVISKFNGEMQNIHGQADRKMIERLAEEYGVRPEDIQPVTITNKPGDASVKVDPGAPVKDHTGQASSWKGDGSIEHSRAARSSPGTVDGPKTGRLADAPQSAPKGDKVSFDRDLTMRVRTIENGRVVYRDIPSSTTARIYNEEFFEAATGKTLTSKRGPDHIVSVDGSNKLGNSVDFKDTHLSPDNHIKDIVDIDDPDIFARRMDQATTDRLHPEAYGTGQADLDTATKDSYRGRDLTDAGGTAKTVEFKVHHWMNEADSLREMAAKTKNAGARNQLLEQAAAHHEEAQRQLIKQYGNMAVKRTGAMQMLGNAPGAKIPHSLSERINVLKRTQLPISDGGLTPAMAEEALKRMGTSTKQVAGQLSSYVEGLQTLRQGPVASKTGPSIVFQGWQDDFKTEQKTS